MARTREIAGVSRGGEILVAPLDMFVIIEGYNIVRDYNSVDQRAYMDNELKPDLFANGVKEAVLVAQGTGENEGKLVIRHGETRIRSLRELVAEHGADSDFAKTLRVPFRVQDKHVGEMQELAEQLSRNTNFAPTAMGKARVYKRAYDLAAGDYSVLERLFAKSRSHIEQTLNLLGGEQAVVTAIETGKLAPSTARELKRLAGEKGISATALLTQAARVKTRSGGAGTAVTARHLRAAAKGSETAPARSKRYSQDQIQVMLTALYSVVAAKNLTEAQAAATHALTAVGETVPGA